MEVTNMHQQNNVPTTLIQQKSEFVSVDVLEQLNPKTSKKENPKN